MNKFLKENVSTKNNIIAEINNTIINDDNVKFLSKLLNAVLPNESEGFRIIDYCSNIAQSTVVESSGAPSALSQSLKNSKVTSNEKKLIFYQIKEKKLLKLLLKIKNGLPLQRKSALKQINEKATEFGPDLIFHHVLPIMLQPTLDDQERHLLVKVIDRVLIKLKSLVRPYVGRILMIVEPLLIEEDFFSRVEGREVIASLSKSVGIASMISALRPDLDNIDDYVRNTCARAFSIVAISLGVKNFIPFLKAVSKSKKSWYARHTGIKIVQQLSLTMGKDALNYLTDFLEIIKHGLVDENSRIRIVSALAVSSLAQACKPYGIDSFSEIFLSLWKGIKTLKGRILVAFLKALCSLIPSMDEQNSYYYSNETIIVAIQHLNSPDIQMKVVALELLSYCSTSKYISKEFFIKNIYAQFFDAFWNARTMNNTKMSKLVIDVTISLENKVGIDLLLLKLLKLIYNENSQLRNYSYNAIENIMNNSKYLVNRNLLFSIVDRMINLFEPYYLEKTQSFVTSFCSFLGNYIVDLRIFLPKIFTKSLGCINSSNFFIRELGFKFLYNIVYYLESVEDSMLINQINSLSIDYIGQTHSDLLIILLKIIEKIMLTYFNVLVNSSPIPLVKKILPLIKHENEEVQFHCINIISLIANRNGIFIPPREWMRISFDLLEAFKAKRKKIRRAAVNCFGIIASFLGPQDLVCSLLNNLKVQDRHIRICTSIAIAVIAENCSSFTVLPFLFNEYNSQDFNTQNGVLKSISFITEFVGEYFKDYLISLIPLLENSMTHFDNIHRQISCNIIQVKLILKHLSLSLYDFGFEDIFVHLFNFVWPNIFENQSFFRKSLLNAIDALRISIGSYKIIYYTFLGLFHASKRVREIYWNIYNILYIGSQTSLILSYPLIDSYLNKYFSFNIYYGILS